MSEQLFEAEEAVGFALAVALEDPILELLSAVGANKTLRVKLLRHGSNHPTNNLFSAHAALVLPSISLVKTGHFLEESSTEHFRHIFLFERLVNVTQTSGKISSSIANLNFSLWHAVVTLQALHQIVELLAGLVRLG